VTEVISYIGSICLSLCALPLAISVVRTKSTKDIDGLFLTLWFVGEVCLLIPYYEEIPLLVNYSFNIACLLIISYYKIKSVVNNK